MTRTRRSDSLGAWHPLPSGWVSVHMSHLLVPDVDASPCRATAPMEHLRLMPYRCTRREGHGGRHAATVKIPGTDVRQVIAVWSSTPSILEAISTAIDDVTARHRLTETRDEAVSEAMDRVFDEDAEILERLAGS